MIFLNTLRVRSDGCAFYADVIFFDGFAGVDADLIVRFVSVRQSEVIIFGVQFNKRRKKLVLYHLPDDSRHLVAVHFNDFTHFDFFHFQLLLFVNLPFILTESRPVVKNNQAEIRSFTMSLSLSGRLVVILSGASASIR